MAKITLSHAIPFPFIKNSAVRQQSACAGTQNSRPSWATQGRGEFVDVRSELDCGHIHLLQIVVAYEVDDEFSRSRDVAAGILRIVRRPMQDQKPTVAGSSPKALKNENGAALVRPASSSVETQAIGRGVTVADRSLYLILGSISANLKSMAIFRGSWFGLHYTE